MARLREYPSATGDVRQIASYIAQDNPAAAKRVIHAIAEAYQSIQKFPKLGKPLPDGFRLKIVNGFNQYLILYEYHQEEDIADILRVLRANQDYTRILASEDWYQS